MDNEIHLLIDGYNVIHDWPELRRLLLRNKDRGAEARERLVSEIRCLHDSEAIAATIIFDGKNAQTTLKPPSSDSSFTVIYAAAATSADGVIEGLVAKSKTPQNVTGVTQDRMIIETLHALGASVLSPEALKQWIIRCKSVQSERVIRHSSSINTEWKQHLKLPLYTKARPQSSISLKLNQE